MSIPTHQTAWRWGDLPDGPVPAVPAAAGSRLMTVVAVVVALMGLGFLVLTALAPAPLAKAVGLADSATATVTAKEYRTAVGPRSGCDFYRFEVSWSDRTGHFTVCDNPDYPATRLEVGDRVEIAAVPWSSEVTAEGTEGDLFWNVAGLAAGAVLLPLGIVWVRRHRRLAHGSLTGRRLTGRVTRVTRGSVRVALETPGLEDRTLVLLPAKRTAAVAVADRVDVWSSRRTWLTRRPGGPWVVEAAGVRSLFTHAWLRRRRG